MFVQRCIKVECGSEFDLDERLYVCARCGDLLDIERTQSPDRDAESLRVLWRERLQSSDARDRSGVWRFREFLPFDDDVAVISLAEGNTPLYDAPRSADYCGLTALKLKHQGNNPTGSFKDTGMTVAVHGSRSAYCFRVGSVGSGSPRSFAAR